MFIPNADKPPHEYIGKEFVLNKVVTTTAGTFQKGTVMTCTEVRISSVWLTDGHGNNLHMNIVDFLSDCVLK